MRTVGAGQSAQPGNITPRVEVEDDAGTMVDRSSDVRVVAYEETVDEIVNACIIEFRRGSGSSSLAPLMTANPPLGLNRDVKVSVPVGGGTYKEVFKGQIDRIDWKNRFGRVQIDCRDQGGVIADTFITEAREYGSEAGVDLEAVMQSVADDNLSSPPTIYVPTATGAVVSPSYEQQRENVLQAERVLSEAIGWTIRWRYIDSLSDWRWTLFEPSRSKSVADHTFGTADYFDVTEMNLDNEDIRNVIRVYYTNAETGNRESAQYPAEADVASDPSVTKYGRRDAIIEEADDSPINDATKALKLATAAYNDLSEPDAILAITASYFWPGEIGVDLYTFTANGEHFSSDQTLAPVSFNHRIEVGRRAETTILCRGKPSGGSLMWRRRRTTPKEADLALSNVKADRTGSTVVLSWDRPGDVDDVWVYDVLRTPENQDQWPSTSDLPSEVLATGTDTYTTTLPNQGKVRLVQLVGKRGLKPGPVRRFYFFPLQAKAIVARKTTTYSDGASYGLADVVLEVADDGEQSGTLELWTNTGGIADPDPSTTADASFTVSHGQTVGPTGGTADVTTDALNDIPVAEGSGSAKTIYARWTATDGRSTGLVAFVLVKMPREISTSGAVASAALAKSAQSFGSDISFSASDHNTVAWSSGSIELADGTSYSITAGNTGDMAALTYVYLDTAVSTTALQTTTVFSNTVGDDRILMAIAQNSGDGTTNATYIPAQGILGLNGEHINPLSISTNNLGANIVTAAKINVAQLSAVSADMGTLTAGKIDVGNIEINASTEQILFGSATDPTTGTGIFMGLSGGVYQFRVGDPSGANMLWDGSSLTLAKGVGGAVRRDHINVTESSTTGTTEEDLMSRTLPTLSDQDAVEFRMAGSVDISSGSTKRVKVYLAGTIIGSITYTTTPTEAEWEISGLIVRDGLNSRVWIGITADSSASMGAGYVSVGSSPSGAVLKVTGQTAVSSEPVTAKAFLTQTLYE